MVSIQSLILLAARLFIIRHWKSPIIFLSTWQSTRYRHTHYSYEHMFAVSVGHLWNLHKYSGNYGQTDMIGTTTTLSKLLKNKLSYSIWAADWLIFRRVSRDLNIFFHDFFWHTNIKKLLQSKASSRQMALLGTLWSGLAKDNYPQFIFFWIMQVLDRVFH